MRTLLIIGAAIVMILLFDGYAKWQMAAIASHYAKAPVYEMAATFAHDPSSKARLLPLLLLFSLAVCLVFEALAPMTLAVAAAIAVCFYCVILFRCWSKILKAAQQANGS